MFIGLERGRLPLFFLRQINHQTVQVLLVLPPHTHLKYTSSLPFPACSSSPSYWSWQVSTQPPSLLFFFFERGEIGKSKVGVGEAGKEGRGGKAEGKVSIQNFFLLLLAVMGAILPLWRSLQASGEGGKGRKEPSHKKTRGIFHLQAPCFPPSALSLSLLPPPPPPTPQGQRRGEGETHDG